MPFNCGVQLRGCSWFFSLMICHSFPGYIIFPSETFISFMTYFYTLTWPPLCLLNFVKHHFFRYPEVEWKMSRKSVSDLSRTRPKHWVIYRSAKEMPAEWERLECPSQRHATNSCSNYMYTVNTIYLTNWVNIQLPLLVQLKGCTCSIFIQSFTGSVGRYIISGKLQ